MTMGTTVGRRVEDNVAVSRPSEQSLLPVDTRVAWEQ
jgi:hypothetical protein